MGFKIYRIIIEVCFKRAIIRNVLLLVLGIYLFYLASHQHESTMTNSKCTKKKERKTKMHRKYKYTVTQKIEILNESIFTGRQTRKNGESEIIDLIIYYTFHVKLS